MDKIEETVIRIDENVKFLRNVAIPKIERTNDRQWELIRANEANLKAHMASPHCGEEDKESKEVGNAIVVLVKAFFKSKGGKGISVGGIILAAIYAAKELGWLFT